MRLVRNNSRVGSRAGFRARGATLIELLVVVALIGLLVSMLIPSLKGSMRVASATVCKHHLREIGHALTLYRIENDGWLPAGKPVDLTRLAMREAEPWFAKLFPMYLSDPASLVCPADPFGFRMRRMDRRLNDPTVADYASYGINGFIMSSGSGALARLDRRQPTRPLDTILLADIGPDNEAGAPVQTVGPYRNASFLRWDDGYDPFAQDHSNPWVTTRHGQGINVLTLAGGVRDAQTKTLVNKPMQRRYRRCSAGGCTFCNDLRLFHYSFAADHLYWWTGAAPRE